MVSSRCPSSSPHRQIDKRALAVLDEAVAAVELTAEQRAMLDRVKAVLDGERRPSPA